MLNSKITNRYAKALLELALSENRLEEINKDLEYVVNVISSIRGLSLLLKSPIVKRDKKRSVVREVFKDKVSDTVLKFCELVINRQRSELLLDIIKKFFDLRDDYLNIKNVYVKSAIEFDQIHIEKLKSVLEQKLNKKVRLNISIDKKLIGGFVAQIDDTVIDASLKHQLEILKKKFLSGSEKFN